MVAIPRARMEKRVRKESRQLVKEARRGLRRHADRIPSRVRDQLRLGADALDGACTDEDARAIRGELVHLDDLVDEHLAFARKSTWREYVESIGVAVLIALVLRAFVVEAFKIPSGSMIPTMEIGDHIFVNKFLYGVRVPFTDAKIGEWRDPRRGEVIVFRNPCEPDKDFIKRVVAVGGDTVEVRCNELYVNSRPVPSTLADENVSYWDHKDRPGTVFGASCEVESLHASWARCWASDYVESHGGSRYHTYYGPERPDTERQRESEASGTSYWAYHPGGSGARDRYPFYSEHDFPELPPVKSDALVPDGEPVDPPGPSRLEGIHRLLRGEGAESIAADLSRRHQGDTWCDRPSCITPDDVESWLPSPAACEDPHGQLPHEAWRKKLVIPPKDAEEGPCGPVLAYRVPDGHVFAMGDNREKSSDSRVWGSVPLENIKGKALFIWWSSKPDRAGGKEWHRVGKLVE